VEAVDEAIALDAGWASPPVPDQVDSDDLQPSLSSFGRLPAATIVLGMATGVLCDRFGSWSSDILLAGFAAACLVWAAAQALQRMRVAAVLVVAISAIAGAIYHHHVWHRLPSRDIAPLLSPQPVLIRCEGVVASPPVVTPPRENPFNPQLPPQSSTQFELAVENLDVRNGRRSVSGRLQIVVDGIVEGVHVGNRVDIQGWSQSNRPLRNPGGFDDAAFNRSKGLRGIVRVSSSELVSITDSGEPIFQRFRRILRQRAESVLESAIHADVRPVADAMLLGDRSLLPREVRTVFVESGTVHLLAISGLHIGILMMFLLAIGRMLRLSSRHSILLAMVVLFIYLQVADCRPPMIRAFVIIAIWSVGRLVRRSAFSANSLAIAAIVLLGLNPTSLFDVGTQLSFLAVAVIVWLTSLGRLSNGEPDVAALSDSDARTTNGSAAISEAVQRPWVRSLKSFGKKIGAMWLVSGSIWLISAPLVISVFNVVSPAGLVINVLLIPVVGIGLCSGFAAILLGVFSQTIAWPFAWVFGWFLELLIATIDLAASIELGHAYVPEPPDWWLVVFYTAVAMAMLATTLKRRPARGWIVVGVWTMFGLTWLPADREEGSLRCTVLSVGHGLSMIVETPSGGTLVYDVGSRAGGELSSRVLKEALWARGISKVNALIVSHSDVDHYNGVLDLLESLPVGSILCSRHFPDSRQPLTLKTLDRAEELGVLPSFIAQGDRLSLDDAVTMRILQPAAATSYDSDNAASVVLEIEFQGRRILLTGDLDEVGLEELLKQPARKVDVLLAPHHGSTAANPAELAAWASPTFVIASAPTPSYQKQLELTYGHETHVVTTSDSGAVTATISRHGELDFEPFVNAAR
tara:strand:+ start:196822 stop:199407 length:2586 start_codon:yes stop_codon:yes gene_type:complete